VGGGHTPWASSANINGGVTIDMRLINATTINKDNTVPSVGAGAVWVTFIGKWIPWALRLLVVVAHPLELADSQQEVAKRWLHFNQHANFLGKVGILLLRSERLCT